MIANLQGGAKPPEPPVPAVQTAPAVFPTGGVAQVPAPAAFGSLPPDKIGAPQVGFTLPPALNFGQPVVVQVPEVFPCVSGPGLPAVSEVPAFSPPPAVAVPEPKKRVRRTKEQIAADEAAKAQAQVTNFQTPEGELVGEIHAPVQFSAPEVQEQESCGGCCDSDPLDPLVRELALAMACNPACATLPAGDFASRAWSLAEALRGL
jgi:hypothetical protein